MRVESSAIVGALGKSVTEAPRVPFSKEGFLDALVEWIVSDDQVCVK